MFLQSSRMLLNAFLCLKLKKLCSLAVLGKMVGKNNSYCLSVEPAFACGSQ